jgi:nitrite reductase/ring-hydroxylating ferredoxin subunit
MAFVKIAAAADIAADEVLDATVGDHHYAVCRVGDELHCLDGECPCTGGPLSQGSIRHGLLVCPWHGWRFDYKTGICAYDDSLKIAMFAIKVEGGDVLIDVSQPINDPTA